MQTITVSFATSRTPLLREILQAYEHRFGAAPDCWTNYRPVGRWRSSNRR